MIISTPRSSRHASPGMTTSLSTTATAGTATRTAGCTTPTSMRSTVIWRTRDPQPGRRPRRPVPDGDHARTHFASESPRRGHYTRPALAVITTRSAGKVPPGSADLKDVEADDDTVVNGIRALVGVDGAVGLQGAKPGGDHLTPDRHNGQRVFCGPAESADKAVVRPSGVPAAATSAAQLRRRRPSADWPLIVPSAGQ